MQKRHREIMRIAKELGWEFERETRKGSIIVRHKETGERCTFAATPSCCHAHANNIARLRRPSHAKRQAS